MQALGAPPPDAQQMPSPYGAPTPQRGMPKGAEPKSAPKSKAMDYTLKGLGLLAVAVVAGLAWYLIRNNPAPPPSLSAPPSADSGGVYTFQLFNEPDMQTDCVAHSTNKVQQYLRTHPCQSLTRKLYTTSLQNTDRVITSVEVVQMASPEQARALNTLSNKDASGHILDQVEEGAVVGTNGPHTLEDGGYYSEAKGNRVIIAVTEYVDNTKDSPANLTAEKSTLQAVSQDALRLGQR